MKTLALITILTALALTGCETVDADGNITRFDAKAATSIIETGFDIYRQSRIIGYDQAGRPIYAQ